MFQLFLGRLMGVNVGGCNHIALVKIFGLRVLLFLKRPMGLNVGKHNHLALVKLLGSRVLLYLGRLIGANFGNCKLFFFANGWDLYVKNHTFIHFSLSKEEFKLADFLYVIEEEF